MGDQTGAKCTMFLRDSSRYSGDNGSYTFPGNSTLLMDPAAPFNDAPSEFLDTQKCAVANTGDGEGTMRLDLGSGVPLCEAAGQALSVGWKGSGEEAVEAFIAACALHPSPCSGRGFGLNAIP